MGVFVYSEIKLGFPSISCPDTDEECRATGSEVSLADIRGISSLYVPIYTSSLIGKRGLIGTRL
jgi:hypothetical protein